jgi:hypothetical protein
MGMQARWFIENRVAIVELTGKPTDTEFRAGDEELVKMMQSVPGQTVHLLLDFSNATSLPPFNALRTLQSRRQPNKGWVIIFGEISPLIRAIAELAARALGDKMHMFRYRRDAMRFLKQIEPEMVLPAEASQP